MLGVRSRPLVHPDRYVLQILATVLGGGMSSRLFTEVRERRGLAYYVYGTNHSYTDAGSLYAQSGVDINRIDEAVTTIVEQFQLLADEPVPSDELEKARNFAKGRFVLQLESPHGTIMFGLRREVLEGRAEEPQAVLDALDAVTAEDVQRVAQEILDAGLPPRRDRPVRRRRAVREAARLGVQPERGARLGDRLARVLDRGRVPGIAQAHLERPLERLERLLVLAGVEVLPAEVVQQRAEPVRRPPPRSSASSIPRFVHSTKPSRSGAASAHMCAASPASQSSPASTAWRRRIRRAAAPPPCRPPTAAAGRARGRRGCGRADRRPFDLVEQASPASKLPTQPFDARQLRQRLRSQGTEARLGRVEVVEVPVAGGADRSSARRREVLVVAEAAPHFQPTAANARTSTPPAPPCPCGRAPGRDRRAGRRARPSSRGRTGSRPG